MPLDGHSYLVSQGWGGKGTGLREGAISRPLAIAQKKNLAGLGKDRDEAFPFWDHAAAKAIQIKYMSDDEDTDASTSNEVTLKRTSTGIFSTRRPIEGTPAASGASTPNNDESTPQPLRLSLMASAKRDAAKRGLYSRFFRGPVIGPETIAAEEKRLAALVSEAFDKQNPQVERVTITEHIEVQTADERMAVDLEVSKSSTHRKGKAKDCSETVDREVYDDEEEKRSHKRRRKEEKRRKKEKEKDGISEKSEKHKKDKKHKTKSEKEDRSKTATTESSSFPEPGPSTSVTVEETKESKSERKQRKEEKKRLKLLQKVELATAEERASTTKSERRHSSKSSKKEKSASSKKTADAIDTGHEPTEEGKKKKNKRKRMDDSD